MKNNKGITLIALVVTIIVLLILAAVSIAMLTGQNGILKRSQEASYSNDVGNAKDEIAMEAAEAITNWNAVKYGNSTAVTITQSTLDEYIKIQLNAIKDNVERNYDVTVTIQEPTTSGNTTTPGSITVVSKKDSTLTTSTTWNKDGDFSAWSK